MRGRTANDEAVAPAGAAVPAQSAGSGLRTPARDLPERETQRREQAALLEQVAAEALRAWERSCRPVAAEKVVTRRFRERDGFFAGGEEGLAGVTGPGEGDEVVETTREVREQTGNAALLAQARGALADLRELWGLNAPRRLATESGEPVKLYVGVDLEQV